MSAGALATRFQEQKASQLFSNAIWNLKCVDDNDPTLPSHRPQGTASVACMWAREIDQFITPLHDGSDRLLAMKIQHTEGNLILVNTYMPTAGTHTDVKY
jgi:hypothetical protein